MNGSAGGESASIEQHGEQEERGVDSMQPIITSLPHLSIDTSDTSDRCQHPVAIQSPSLMAVSHEDEVPLELADKDTLSNTLRSFSRSQASHRLRAMSESETVRSHNGVRIPQKITGFPSLVNTQLTPPLSYSLDPRHPYSTSAHIFPTPLPAPSLPDSPQSSISESRRIPKLLRSSLGSATSRPESARARSAAEGVSRSLSYSYGTHSPQQTFVDASSYESVPDSPAKLWLQSFAQTTCPTPNPDDEGQEIGSYIIGRQIGVGGFSVVKEAFTIENGREVRRAVKIVRKQLSTSNTDGLRSHIEHEINVWKCLSNRYILPLLTVIDDSYATWAFTLLFEGGTLLDVFNTYRQGLPPALALKYAYQLASALRYLHQDAHVVHRDVKLENCVLDRPASAGGNLRLCDFGLADFLPGDDTPSPRAQFVNPQSSAEKTAHLQPEDMVAGGSLAFAAPEQINSRTPLLDTRIDMWSYGVVLHALVMGELPFYDPFPPKLQVLITSGIWNIDRCKARLDQEISQIIISCLDLDPSRRQTAADILGGSYLSLYAGIDTNTPDN